MKVTARDIDHLSIATPDPEALAIKLQQIGFNLTPEGVEPRCICFQPAEDDIPNYIELIEADVRVAVAVNVTELEGEVREHSWETDDGYEVEAEVIVGEIDGPLPWFPVRHQMPEAFMEPEWIVHPNGALGLLAVHVVSDDPPETAKALGRAVGRHNRRPVRRLHDDSDRRGRDPDLVAVGLPDRIQVGRSHGAGA